MHTVTSNGGTADLEEFALRFDSLHGRRKSAVGVTPEGSAKDLLAHLAYWERATAGQVREFEAGSGWRESARAFSSSASTGRLFPGIGPRHGIFSRGTDPGEERESCAMKRAPEELEEGLRSLNRYSQWCGTGGIISKQLQAWIATSRKTS